MSIEFKAGDEFILEGRRWICIEPKRTRMVALQANTMHMASVHMNGRLEKTGVSKQEFIEAVETAFSNLKPGMTIQIESQKLIVKKVLSNGEIHAENNFGAPYRIPKWAPWWKDFIASDIFLTKENDGVVNNSKVIEAELKYLRSTRWKTKERAINSLRSFNLEAVPFILKNMESLMDCIENAPEKLIGGEGKLNLGFCKVPSPIDQHVLKLSADIIADIATDGYLSNILQIVEKTSNDISNQVIHSILHLKRCREYNIDDFQKSISISPFCADIVFKILSKKRGKGSVDFLKINAQQGKNSEIRISALNHLKAMTSKQAQKAVNEIECKDKSLKK